MGIPVTSIIRGDKGLGAFIPERAAAFEVRIEHLLIEFRRHFVMLIVGKVGHQRNETADTLAPKRFIGRGHPNIFSPTPAHHARPK
jgi:hypothetical protein